MAAFLVPILVLLVLSGGGWTFVFLKVPPHSPITIALFLLLTFIVLWAILTALIFFTASKIYNRFTPLKAIFWEATRRAAFVALLIVSLAALKLFNAFSTLNTALLAGALLATEIYFSVR